MTIECERYKHLAYYMSSSTFMYVFDTHLLWFRRELCPIMRCLPVNVFIYVHIRCYMYTIERFSAILELSYQMFGMHPKHQIQHLGNFTGNHSYWLHISTGMIRLRHANSRISRRSWFGSRFICSPISTNEIIVSVIQHCGCLEWHSVWRTFPSMICTLSKCVNRSEQI